jgi:hypothetical protein
MTCRVCRHKDRPAIERLILDRVEFRTIGRRFNLAKSIIHRHRKHHMADALRRLAQRMEAADAYNSASVAERLQTLNVLNMSLLGKALARENLGAAVRASTQLRENLQFEVDIKEAQFAGSEVRLNVVYGQKSNPELDGKECPTCGHLINLREKQNEYNRAIKRALGLLDDGDAEPQRPATHEVGQTFPPASRSGSAAFASTASNARKAKSSKPRSSSLRQSRRVPHCLRISRKATSRSR